MKTYTFPESIDTQDAMTGPDKTRVLLAIEDPDVSHPMARALGDEPSIEVVGVRKTAGDAVRVVRSLKPDVAVLSSELPDMDVLALLKQLSKRRATHTILLVSDVANEDLTQAVLLGAAGALDRGVSARVLVKCIQSVVDGEYWFPRELTRALVESMREGSGPKRARVVDLTERLTPRETDVMQAAARGKTNREIAEELRMSEHTVKQHLKQVFGKLHVSSRVELVLRVARSGQ